MKNPNNLDFLNAIQSHGNQFCQEAIKILAEFYQDLVENDQSYTEKIRYRSTGCCSASSINGHISKIVGISCGILQEF